MTLDPVAAPQPALELFTCADTIGQSQLNAWGSWARIPGASVSVFGGAPGLDAHARRFGFRSIPSIPRDEFGRPLLSAIFERMHEASAHDVLGYVNSDIILLPGLACSLAAVRERFDTFLIIARRWNVASLPALEFEPGWDAGIRRRVAREGELFTAFGIDLFVFSRGLLRDIPPFALGSDYWDNYLVMRARRRGCPVIDVTEQVMLVHQDHPLGRYRSAAERRRGPEGLRALALAGDSHAMLGQVADATHIVSHGELRRVATEHVTAVIPHHRGDSRRLCHCIRSLEYQSYPQSYLDTVVVNNDPDAPLRYLEADFPSLRVVTEIRGGAAAARNKGVSCARAEVIALFDDVVPDVNCLERAMRALREHPGAKVVACRAAPHFASGKPGYFRRAVEWFDVAAHYNPNGWITDAGACLTRALVVRREVFAEHGYFNELCPEIAAEEWARRLIGAGVGVAFCRHAFVWHETVKSSAEMRRKKQRDAWGDCIRRALESDRAYGAGEVVRRSWRELRRDVRSVWANERIPPRYRAGALLVAVRCCLWTLRARLQGRHAALVVVRKRRRAMERMARAGTEEGTRRAGSPIRRLAIGARRVPRQGAMRRSPAG